MKKINHYIWSKYWLEPIGYAIYISKYNLDTVDKIKNIIIHSNQNVSLKENFKIVAKIEYNKDFLHMVFM